MNLSQEMFMSVWTSMKDLVLNSLSWIHSITIGGVSLLYINLGFVLMITLFAILLPVLRNSGAQELNDRGIEMSADIRNNQRNRAIKRGSHYVINSNGSVSGASSKVLK